MKLVIAAIGRLKDGAERSLCEHYRLRLDKAGPRLALGPAKFVEMAEGRQTDAPGRRSFEAGRLLAAAEGCDVVVALDEGGKRLSSVEFATMLANRRDQGVAAMAFLIGGPDGHGNAVRERAELTLSLGAMTWPHGLARILLCEQLYRATTILSGHPYHRG